MFARPLLFAGSLAAACFAAACASSPSDPVSAQSESGISGSASVTTPTSPTAAAGATWTLQSMRRADGSTVTVPSGEFTLLFEDGRIAIRADCNVCSSTYTLEGTALDVGGAMACTRAWCATEPFATQYTTAIANGRTALVRQGTLSLESSDGTVLVFGR